MIEFDLSAFERRAAELGGAIDQIPFALSQALNEAAINAREVLIRSTWPGHVQQRNASFIRAALKVERSTKRSLTVAISDTGSAGGRANLKLHSRGGTRSGHGRKLAIPSTELKAKRGSKGVPKNLRPRALKDAFLRGDTLFQRVGPKGRKLRAAYTLRGSARIKADVPFEADFEAAMRHGVRTAFPAAMAKAMRSRRR